MLHIDAILTRACPKETNLSETIEIGKTKVMLSSGGHRFDPVYTGVYVSGLPFGVGAPPLPAPIELLAGDTLKVVADLDDRAVWSVTRAGKTVWLLFCLYLWWHHHLT